MSDKMSQLALHYQPIDLQRHADVCVQFFEDTRRCSFGTLHGEPEDEQPMQHAAERIAAKLAQDPQSCLHVWRGSAIVGQINFGTYVDPTIGYISHFYVVPAWRGTGIAAQMEAYACEQLQGRRYKIARLSVSPANLRAVRFYQKHGWRDLGPRTDNPALHNMEKEL